MDFFNAFSVGDSGGEPVLQKAELEGDVQLFADYEKQVVLPSLCVVA
jgi:hypothetical protein